MGFPLSFGRSLYLTTLSQLTFLADYLALLLHILVHSSITVADEVFQQLADGKLNGQKASHL